MPIAIDSVRAPRSGAEPPGLADRHEHEADALSARIDRLHQVATSDEWDRFFEQLVSVVEEAA